MLQIAICDDDQRDLKRLELILEKIMEKYSIRYNIVAYDSGEELLKSQDMFHLIFLDIRMEKMDGIEIGKKIYRRNRNVKVIFQTHYGEYFGDAVNKSHAFAFLKKPLSEAAVEMQIREFFETKESVQEIWMEFRHINYLSEKNNLEKEILKLPIRDIFYFEYLKRERNVKVVTERGIFSYSEVMNLLEKRMRPFGFEICSRGILVNMDKIQRIKGHNILLCNNNIIPLSQRRTVYFKERMNEFTHDSFIGNYE